MNTIILMLQRGEKKKSIMVHSQVYCSTNKNDLQFPKPNAIEKYNGYKFKSDLSELDQHKQNFCSPQMLRISITVLSMLYC